MLLNSAFLIIKIKKFGSPGTKRKISVAQKVTESAVIYLDTINIDDDDDDVTVQLDVTHAVQAWIQDPSLNLGLKLVLEGVEVELDEDEGPELVLNSQHALLRQKRATYLSTEIQERISSATDCRFSRGKKNCCRYCQNPNTTSTQPQVNLNRT